MGNVSPFPEQVQTFPPLPDPPPSGVGDTDMETTAARLMALARNIERSMGTQCPLEDHWGDPQPAICQEVGEAWPAAVLTDSSLMFSSTHDVLRLMTLDPDLSRGGTLRYITPQRVWAFTVPHRGGGISSHPPVRTPDLPAFLSEAGSADKISNQAELRLGMMALWADEALDPAHGTPVVSNVVTKYDDHDLPSFYIADVVGGRTCPACCTTCGGPARTIFNRFTDKLTLSCPGLPDRRTVRLTSLVRSYLFGGRAGARCPEQPAWQRPGPDVDSAASRLALGDTRALSRPSPDGATSTSRDLEIGTLSVLQYNMDKLGHRTIGHLLSMAEEAGTDIICLQEVENVAWSTHSLTELGWNLYRHSKVAILLRVSTAESICLAQTEAGAPCHHVWRSERYDSMALSLQTSQGALLVGNIYAPPGVDSLPSVSAGGGLTRGQVEEMHQEMQTQILLHTHAILCMDRNETEGPEGRVQLRDDGSTVLSGADNSSPPTTSCYDSSLVNVMDIPHLPPARTGLSSMTHVQRGPSMAIHSAIDAIYCSHALAQRTTKLTIDDRTRHWGLQDGGTRKSYHKALTCKWSWVGLWPRVGPPPSPKAPLRGSELKKGPNYKAWTDNRAASISRKVDTHLASSNTRNEIRKIVRSRRLTPEGQRDALLHILKRSIVTVAEQVLPQSPTLPPTEGGPSEAHSKWAELLALVTRLLRHDISSHFSPPIELDHPGLTRLRKWFSRKGISLPSTVQAWARWWPHRDQYRADALLACSELSLTDSLARFNPKKFYKLATGPLTVPKITVLQDRGTLITDDLGIEDACTKALERIGGPCPEERIEPDKGLENPALGGLMDKIDMDELLSMASQIDTSSCPGYDTLAPRLLKTVLTRPWYYDVPKGPDQHRQDSYHWRFAEEMRQYKATGRWSASHSEPPPGTYPPTYSKCFQPSHAPRLLLRILNLCIQTGDIPSSEKLGVVSALPKAEGQIYTLDAMRPITVGPAFSRFFHKILAHRLSRLMVEHKIMDPAQSAFLPGRDIHGPISAALACYRDRAHHDKSLYAIYYDISKAYDTVRWSSISRAMNRLGLPIGFIEMVMNILKGTTLVMRTNRKGRVTPVVEVHQSIKQGCPLAPLLFTMVMDELHRELRKVGGYTLSGCRLGGQHARIHSLGYCDDTTIMASSISSLEKMNRVVYSFCNTHGLRINKTKTKVTGRSAGGAPFTGRIHWPGSSTPFKTVPPGESIRHLGALISLDLDWRPQIKRMRATILHTVACLSSRRLTLYQGCLLTKYVNGPKLEIGLRHAPVPAPELEDWDRRLSKALAGAAGLHKSGIHVSSASTILRYTPVSDLYLQAQTAQILDMILKPSGLRDFHRSTLGPIVDNIDDLASSRSLRTYNPASAWDPGRAASLLALAQHGVRVRRNTLSDWEATEDPLASDVGDVHCCFGGITIPMKTRESTTLWGKSFDHLNALLPLVLSHPSGLGSVVQNHTGLPSRVASEIAHFTLGPPSPPPPEGVEPTPRNWMEAFNILSGPCRPARSHKTFHHPNCPHTGVTGSRSGPPTTLLHALRKGLKRSSCRACSGMWKGTIDRARDLIRPMVCTDGSTIPGSNSAAAMAFVEDDIHRRDLWQVEGSYWPMTSPNNHSAELSGIDSGIRSTPVGVHVRIPTDSMASKLSIERALSDPFSSPLLRMAGRPFILSAVRAARVKANWGAKVTITHVRSHTGLRDRASLGNEAADRLANWQAKVGADPGEIQARQASLLKNELPFVVALSTWVTPPDGAPPTEHISYVHGDIRRAIRNTLAEARCVQWSLRPARGRLPRANWKGVSSVISSTWAQNPGSTSLSWALRGLNDVTRKRVIQGSWLPEPCDRCGTGHDRTFGGDLQCPANSHIWNSLDDTLAKELGLGKEEDLDTVCDLTLLTKSVAKALASCISTQHVMGGRTIRVCDASGRPMGSLDTINQVRPLASSYVLTAIKDNRESDDPYLPLPHLPPLSSPRVSRDLSSLARRLVGWLGDPLLNRPHLASALRDIARTFLRTFSDLYAGDRTDPCLPLTRWWSDHRADGLIGAMVGPKADFLSDSYTWVSLPPPSHQLEIIGDSATAILASRGRARVVLLLTDEPSVHRALSGMWANATGPRGRRPRHHIIATFPPGTVQLGPTLGHCQDEGQMTINPSPLLLAVAETPNMPDTDLGGLGRALAAYCGTFSPPPWDTGHPPLDLSSSRDDSAPPSLTGTRYHPTLRPALNWYRSDVPLLPRHSDSPPSPHPADSHDRVLGMMGLLPSIHIDLPIPPLVHPPTHTRFTLDKISKIILDTSLEAFRKSEIWAKWKRRN